MAMEHKQPAAKYMTSSQYWTTGKYLTPREHWTTVLDRPTQTKDVKKDFEHVARFEKHKVQLLEKIGEGGQGTIHTAAVYVHNNHLNEEEQLPVPCAVKKFRVGGYGKWPEKVFELSKLSQNICGFLGYFIDGDTVSPTTDGVPVLPTIYLIMNRYDCSLRGAIDKQMEKKKNDLVCCVAFAIFYFLFVFYALTGYLKNYIPANPMSILTCIMPEWYFLPLYAILQSIALLGGVVLIRLVYLSFSAYYIGRPLEDGRVMLMMIHIALGMRVLHESKILHRDLKADNVFVKCKPSYGLPIAAYVGDFDDGSNVLGTLFWRAPEVLQAIKDGVESQEIEFKQKADVYSYAMTCYEILTGNIPLRELKRTNYDAVLFGKRPKLPMNLNSKVTALIERCWHHNPDMRPTFCDIVIELEELVNELVTGSQAMSKTFNIMFDRAKIFLNIARADAESNLIELKELLQVLVMKYNQADFLLLGLEVVAAMEEFQCKFGFQSFKKHPNLPYSEFFARLKLFDIILWKRATFARICAYIVELDKINILMESILDTINADSCPENCFYTDEANATKEVIDARDVEWKAYKLKVKGRMENQPSAQHRRCIRKQINPKSQDDEFQACNLCKFNCGASDEGNVKYWLYVDNDESAFKKLDTFISSSLKAIKFLFYFIYYFTKALVGVMFSQYFKFFTSRIM